MNYSLNKIAKELDLSKTTVSLVLSGKSESARISKDVEKKVKDFCEQVHYSPNIHAQRINKKYVKNIGLLVDKNLMADNANPLSDINISEIIGSVIVAAEKVGYRVSLDLYYHQMQESKIFEWFRNKEIDGLIYYGLSIPETWRQTFFDEGRKIVGIGIEPCEGISSVNLNNCDVMKELTEKLIASGKKNFIFLDGRQNSYVGKCRKNGFLEALKQNNISIADERILNCKFAEKEAYDNLVKILPELKDTDAIVCANDMMAIGALRAVKECNREDIKVTGADNIPLADYVSPSLTTINNMSNELGEKAFKLLIDMIKGKKEFEDVIVKSNIVRRESF